MSDVTNALPDSGRLSDLSILDPYELSGGPEGTRGTRVAVVCRRRRNRYQVFAGADGRPLSSLWVTKAFMAIGDWFTIVDDNNEVVFDGPLFTRDGLVGLTEWLAGRHLVRVS